MRFKLVFAAFFLIAALAAHAQVVPSATRGRVPLLVGVGASDYYTDWTGNLDGATLWIDVPLYHVPRMLQGIGLEIEGRDLNYDRTGYDPKLRQDTAEGGAIYRWTHFRNFRPYGKFLMGFGSEDFSDAFDPYYTHDTRTIMAQGVTVGAEYDLRHLFARH
jgi:hypothetical protein